MPWESALQRSARIIAARTAFRSELRAPSNFKGTFDIRAPVGNHGLHQQRVLLVSLALSTVAIRAL
jgi:hypothetical protein